MPADADENPAIEETEDDARETEETDDCAEELPSAAGWSTGGIRLPRCPPVEGDAVGTEDVETLLTEEVEEETAGGASTIWKFDPDSGWTNHVTPFSFI